MKSKLAKFTFLLISIVVLSSCLKMIYGIKTVKKVDEMTIMELGDKYNIPPRDSYQMDTTYFSYLLSLDTVTYKSEIKNHYQPLQALYYKVGGDLESFQVNCYAPNLNWERDSIMKSFPPREQAPIDTILPLKIHLKYLNPLTQTKSFSISDYDYVVVVHWNRFMGRQSEKLIKLIQENEKLSGDLKVKIVYVNSDNCFI